MSTTLKYRYEALDAAGKMRSGALEADSESAAVARLTKQGYTPLAVTVKPTGGMHKEITIFPKRVKLKDLALLLRQFATMIGAGLSMLRVLSILSEQTENAVLADTLREVKSAVETGSSLSDALEAHPRIFPPLMIHMIRAGEVGGFLDRALVGVAENLESEVRLRAKIKTAMSYPAIVGIVAILIVVGMLLFIVPTFRGIFAELGGSLPFTTRVIVAVSDALKVVAPGLVVALFAGGAAWSRVKHTQRVREFVDPIKLRLPVFGELFRKVFLARMTRNLSGMLSAGVPMLQGLDVVGQTTGSTVISRALSEVREAVRNGEGLAGPMGQQKVFPPMVVQMVAVGEDSGSLDELLRKIAEYYDQEVEATTDSLTALIEPIMIVFLGAIVGFMIVSLYLPIFKVFDLIQ